MRSVRVSYSSAIQQELNEYVANVVTVMFMVNATCYMVNIIPSILDDTLTHRILKKLLVEQSHIKPALCNGGDDCPVELRMALN